VRGWIPILILLVGPDGMLKGMILTKARVAPDVAFLGAAGFSDVELL
jgi:hypothetical protein